MASNTQNVVRYTALLGGIVYGFVHNRTVNKEANANAVKHAQERREHLIAEAKKAYQEKKAAKSKSGPITDPEDPKFDLEKLIASWEKSA